MKSPVFLNENELKLWAEQNGVHIGGGMGEIYPTEYPCMIIYDEIAHNDTVYYHEFQKRRYSIFGD